MLLLHVSVHIKPSSGNHIQCLANIAYLVPMCVSILMLSVMEAYAAITDGINISALLLDM